MLSRIAGIRNDGPQRQVGYDRSAGSGVFRARLGDCGSGVLFTGPSVVRVRPRVGSQRRSAPGPVFPSARGSTRGAVSHRSPPIAIDHSLRIAQSAACESPALRQGPRHALRTDRLNLDDEQATSPTLAHRRRRNSDRYICCSGSSDPRLRASRRQKTTSTRVCR